MLKEISQPAHDSDLKQFLLVLRQALLIVLYWIEDKYQLPPPTRYRERVDGRR